MESGRTRGNSGHGNPGLSSTTVRSLHLMLHNALNRAVKERLILRNPTEDCIAPKVQKFEMQILQPEHIKTYLDAADKRGLPDIRFHDLRHTFATMALQNGVDVKTVSSMLGTTMPDSHSVPTPTLRGRSKTRPHKRWAASWRRSCKPI